MNDQEERIQALELQNRSLEERVRLLESKRPGRKGKPILVSEAGVCGIDPSRNSAMCPDATLYRKQQGCLGTACSAISTAYYAHYRGKADLG